MRKPMPREQGDSKACNSIQTNWLMGQNRDPRHRATLILKVLPNSWYITEIALQNSEANLDYLINGAETNAYPYGKKWNWIFTSHYTQQSIPDG